MPTTRSSSCTRSQNGSNSGSANDLRPFHVGTGATRIRKIFPPRSWMYSSSLIAVSLPSASEMIGVE